MLQVVDYKLPVCENKIDLYGKKKPSQKCILKTKTAEKLRVNNTDHAIQQKFKIRNQDILTIKDTNDKEYEKIQKERTQKVIQEEKRIREEAQKQLNKEREEKAKKSIIKEQKNSSTGFRNAVHRNYTGIQDTQKISQLRAQSAKYKKFDLEYNQEQQKKTKDFLQKIKQTDQAREQRINQQLQQAKQGEELFFEFKRPIPKSFQSGKTYIEKQKEQKQEVTLQKQQNFLKNNNNQEENEQETEEEKKKKFEFQKQVHEKQNIAIKINNSNATMKNNQNPAPGSHMPKYIDTADKEQKIELEKYRKKYMNHQKQLYFFQGLKCKKLQCQNRFTVKNIDQRNGHKVALVEPSLNKNNKKNKIKKFAFHVLNGFAENIFLGVCRKKAILQFNNNTNNKQKIIEDFQIKCNIKEFLEGQYRKQNGCYLVGNNKKYSELNGAQEIPFNIARGNILIIQFDYEAKTITFTKENTKQSCQLEFKQDDEEDQMHAFCILGGLNDQVEYINDLDLYYKRKEDQKQKILKEIEEQKKKNNKKKDEDKKQWLNNNKEDNEDKKKTDEEQKQNEKDPGDLKQEKKEDLSNKDKQEENQQKEKEQESKKKETEQEKALRIKEELELQKKEKMRIQKLLMSGLSNVKGYYPEAKNRKFVTYSFGKQKRQELYSTHLVENPAPGQYDPVDPKQMRSKAYGSYYKGPLPFISRCQNIIFGKEDRESAGCIIVDGGDGIFTNNEQDQQQKE